MSTQMTSSTSGQSKTGYRGAGGRLLRLQIGLARSLKSKEPEVRYISNYGRGIRRKRNGNGYTYLGPNGRQVGRNDLRRIRALAIPPAWRDVWICPDPHGHLQAVGWDTRKRKQYLYHPNWKAQQNHLKFGRLRQFGQVLPAIRKQIVHDLTLPGLARDKILATIVRLLDTTLIRVGNEVYAKENGSFGLTTLHDRHVSIKGSVIQFSFRGKSGIHHAIELDDRHIAQIIRQSRNLPGYELFQYIGEDGLRRSVHASDVNDYLKRVSGCEVTAKDFRTWAGTVIAAQFVRALTPATSQKEAKRNIVRAVEVVAQRLRNTKSVCRSCYIHPHVLDAYLEGRLNDALTRHGTRHKHPLLSHEEHVLMQILVTASRRSMRQAA